MSGIDRLTIDQHWDRLVALARKAGVPTDQWELVEGDEHSVLGRQPWQVNDTQNYRVVMTLGYTKREVAASLLAMNTILAVTHGA